MPSFLSNKKASFIKAAKSRKNEKKRPESASSQKSDTHSNSSTATVRPIQRETEVIETKHIPEQPIDLIDEEKAMAKKLDELSLTLPKSKSDTGFNNYLVSPTPGQLHIPRTESFGDIKTLHSVKSNPTTPVSYTNGMPRSESVSRGDRSLAMSRNRREATYCKYLLRNAAHRRSASRLSQKVNNDPALRAVINREVDTPSELTSVTSLSSFGSMSSFQSIGSLSTQDASLGKDNLARVMAKENKSRITQLLVLARRRQLAQDDLKNFTLKDIAICGKRLDRAFLLQEQLHYSGVMYPIKLVSIDDLMFPNKKLTIKVGHYFRLFLCCVNCFCRERVSCVGPGSIDCTLQTGFTHHLIRLLMDPIQMERFTCISGHILGIFPCLFGVYYAHCTQLVHGYSA